MVGEAFVVPDIIQLVESIEDGLCPCLRNEEVWCKKNLKRKLYPLSLACYYGQTVIVDYILKTFHSSKVLRRYNMPPLMMAALSSSKTDSVLPIAQLLLQSGMCVKSTDATHPFSALQHAVLKQHKPLVDLLLTYDSSSLDYDFEDNSGFVMSAIWYSVGSPEITEMLVRAGAKVLRPSGMRCPTANAIIKQDLVSLKILVESKTFKINHEYTTSFMNIGDTLLEVALKVSVSKADHEKFKEILNVLMSKGPAREIFNLTRIFSNIPMNQSKMSSVNACAEVLLENGADPDVIDDLGWSPLVHAVMNMKDNASSVEILLKFNVDLTGHYKWIGKRTPNSPSKRRSILYISYDVGKPRIAETMIKYGLDIRKEIWIHKRKADYPVSLRKGIAAKNRLEFLKDQVRKPSNLLQLCRNVIRSHCKARIVGGVQQLGLSAALQKYIMFE